MFVIRLRAQLRASGRPGGVHGIPVPAAPTGLASRRRHAYGDFSSFWFIFLTHFVLHNTIPRAAVACACRVAYTHRMLIIACNLIPCPKRGRQAPAPRFTTTR